MAPTKKYLKSKKTKLSLRKKGGNKSMKRGGRKPAKKTMRKGGNNDKFKNNYDNWKSKCMKSVNNGATYVRKKRNHYECDRDLEKLKEQHN